MTHLSSEASRLETLRAAPTPAAPTLATTEARNALRAEAFHALPGDIPLWRFREVLTKLGAALGLSGGAVVYALDLMGLLTEADWRGDGRAVTYHSVRGYARKVGRTERTICGYEHQLIMAGLVHRTLKHARRHGGCGDERRRTGLDWRSFGAMMPDLLARLDARRAEEERRLDLESRIRAERRLVQDIGEGMEEGRAQALTDRLAALGVLRLRGTPTLHDLEARLLALTLLREELATEAMPVDNSASGPLLSDRSENPDRPIDTTGYSSCPTDIRGAGSRKHEAARSARRPPTPSRIDTIPLAEVWRAAPRAWSDALGPDTPVTWPVLIELADRLAPGLDVSRYAWSRALRVLGPSQAALALLVLDRNRDHPTRPVLSIGGALVGMVRRAEEGGFDLAPSLRGVMGRGPQRTPIPHGIKHVTLCGVHG